MGRRSQPRAAPKKYSPPLSHREISRAAIDVYEGGRTAIGPDGRNPGRLAAEPVARAELDRYIYKVLKDDSWTPWLAHTGTLARPGKKPRTHAVLALLDQIVMRAFLVALDHVWSRIHPTVMGGRPGIRVADAAKVVTSFPGGRRCYGAKFDLVGAFSNAPFEMAMEFLAALTDRRDILRLMHRLYRVQGRRFDGLVEGVPTSPLLLAAVMGKVMPFVFPYAEAASIWVDDGVLLAFDRGDVEAAVDVLEAHLAELGLHLHREGEKAVQLFEFDPNDPTLPRWEFLGRQWRRGQPVPSKSSRQDLLDAIDLLIATGRKHEINAVIAGFAGAFADCAESAADLFTELDSSIEARVMRRAHSGRGVGSDATESEEENDGLDLTESEPHVLKGPADLGRPLSLLEEARRVALKEAGGPGGPHSDLRRRKRRRDTGRRRKRNGTSPAVWEVRERRQQLRPRVKRGRAIGHETGAQPGTGGIHGRKPAGVAGALQGGPPSIPTTGALGN